MSLHLSLTETPEYFGTQTTDGLSLLVFRLMPLNASHCSSRKLFPVTNERSSSDTNIDLFISLNMRLKDMSFTWVLQGSKLQERYFTLRPWQYLPPFSGMGLLQSLLASCTPPPQVREHGPYGPHRPQWPSTCGKSQHGSETHPCWEDWQTSSKWLAFKCSLAAEISYHEHYMPQ